MRNEAPISSAPELLIGVDGANRRGRGDGARQVPARGHAGLSVFATLAWLVVSGPPSALFRLVGRS